MRKYITGEDSTEHISVELGGEFGPLDVARVLNEVRESETPQYFGAKRGGSIMSNLEVRNGLLYFGACDGNFYALDAETGREVWRSAIGDVILSFDTSQDTIFVSCYDHNLHAIGLDGRKKWRFRANGKLGNVLCWHNKIYFGSEGGIFYCLDSKGALKWKFSTSSIIGAKPLVHKGMVLFGDFHGTFYSLDAETGRVLWMFKANGGLGGGRLHDDTIYLPSIGSTFYALSLDGMELWRFSHKPFIVDMIYEPYNDIVFAGSRDGGLYAISTRTRSVAWEFKTREMVNVFVTVDDGAVYFGDLENSFYAVNAETGRLIWTFKTSGPNLGGIAVHNEKVYFGSWDCNVYCLDARNGGILWKFRTSIGSMSDWVVDRRMDRPELSMIVQLPEDAKKEESKAEKEFADYGEFLGAYIEKDKADYVKSGKRGYVREKGF